MLSPLSHTPAKAGKYILDDDCAMEEKKNNEIWSAEVRLTVSYGFKSLTKEQPHRGLTNSKAVRREAAYCV